MLLTAPLGMPAQAHFLTVPSFLKEKFNISSRLSLAFYFFRFGYKEKAVTQALKWSLWKSGSELSSIIANCFTIFEYLTQVRMTVIAKYFFSLALFMSMQHWDMNSVISSTVLYFKPLSLQHCR